MELIKKNPKTAAALGGISLIAFFAAMSALPPSGVLNNPPANLDQPTPAERISQLDKPNVIVTNNEIILPDGQKVTWRTTTGEHVGDSHANQLVDTSSLPNFLGSAVSGFGWLVYNLLIPAGIATIFFRWVFGQGLPGANLLKGNMGGGGGFPGSGMPGTAGNTAGKEMGRWVKPEEISIPGFDAVAGVPEAVTQMKKMKKKILQQARTVARVKEIEDEKPVANPAKKVSLTVEELMLKAKEHMAASTFGGIIPNCALLIGPPGTGKTLLVSALAKECGVPFFSISGSDFVEMFVGLGADRVRRMFADARSNRPCILFIDEIDAVGAARANGVNSNPEKDQTLNQMLVELQGVGTETSNFGLWIIAATNRDDILDPALMRPGRFTWKVRVDPPNTEGAVKVLKVHVNKRGMKLDETVDLFAFASVLPGLSGADLENVINETALFADETREAEIETLLAGGHSQEEAERLVTKKTVTQEDLFEGLLRHLMGLKKEASQSFLSILNTTVHEGGHALATAYERYVGRSKDRVRFIVVEPRGNAGGVCFKTPDEASGTKSISSVDADAVCAFGGSAAQMVVLNEKDSGPDNDFEVASDMIYRAIARWHADEKIGPISLGKRGQMMATQMGDQARNMIDEACRLRSKQLYARSWWIMKLFVKSEHLWTMYREILEKKVMRQDRFEALFELMLKDLAAHPDWQTQSLEDFLAAGGDFADWTPPRLDAETQEYVKRQVESLRKFYDSLPKAAENEGGTAALLAGAGQQPVALACVQAD